MDAPAAPPINPGPFTFARIFGAHFATLAFYNAPTLSLVENLFLLAVHVAGLALVLHLLHVPLILALAPILLFALSTIPRLATRLQISMALLAPFWFLYALYLLRLAYARVLGLVPPTYIDSSLPDWSVPPLYTDAALLAALIYTALIFANGFVRQLRRLGIAVASILFLGTLLWASAEYFGHRTSGTTGSDPYAYVQMAIDLVTRATPLHRFSLFPEIATTGIPWYPIIHVGYHLPGDLNGDAVSVWPLGGALAYALAYKIFGEGALYVVNPLFALASAMVSALLAYELSWEHTRTARVLIGALTATLVATANEQVNWAGVTMVDAQAEFFSVLALYFALRGRNRASVLSPLLAGLALGAAYWVRHTQLVLALSLIVIFWLTNNSRSRRLRALLASGFAALVIALPDLWYHQSYLGGWLRPESEELALFSIHGMRFTTYRMYAGAFAGFEFGWLVPVLIFGAIYFARRARTEFLALAVWLLASLAIQLPYPALRLRDLLPEFSILAFFASYGAIALVAIFLSKKRWRGQLAAGVIVFALIELLALRVWSTSLRPFQPPRAIFGTVTESQRTAFNQLAALTPRDALIGSTLNDGAVELFAQRATFRPAAWSAAELREFLTIVEKNHSAIFLVDDGNEMSAVRADLEKDFTLERLTRLDLPLFEEGIEEPGALWKIENK